MVQRGEALRMPDSRPMPNIGPRCHELRVADRDVDWRIIYRLDEHEILIVHIFRKTTRATSKQDIGLARRRLKDHDKAEREDGDD
jgi:phage-related protein